MNRRNRMLLRLGSLIAFSCTRFEQRQDRGRCEVRNDAL